MKAVLLAAGVSSRFFPYNQRHKCLVEICGEPIIAHTIKSLKKLGIDDLIIVVPNGSDFQQALGNGEKYGVRITYVIQDSPEGAGEAVLLASHHIDSDFYLINSNHVEIEELLADLSEKISGEEVVLLGKKSDGRHLGALKIEGDRVIEVVEKPENNEDFSDLKIVGVYYLTQEFVSILKNTPKEDYSLEAALNECAKKGKVKIATTDKAVLSLKYPWHLLGIKDYILSKIKGSISEKANVSENAIIDGEVIIEDGVTVLENATIKGPCYIGKGAFIGSNTLLRDGTDIEEGSVVGGFMEVKNSLIMKGSKTHSGHLEDSVVGENSRLGALFTSANVRIDRENVTSVIKDGKVDTGYRNLGVMVGSNTQIGARTTTMPGVIIGNNVAIGPSTTVMHNVDSDTSFYTDFNEVVEKKK